MFDLDESCIKNNVIPHFNTWNWGDSHTFIFKNGIGMIHVSITNDEPEVGFISGLSVMPDERRKGIGTSIMEWTLIWCRHQGLKYVRLFADKSGFAFEWYQRLGFSYYGDNASEDGLVPLYMDLNNQ